LRKIVANADMLDEGSYCQTVYINDILPEVVVELCKQMLRIRASDKTAARKWLEAF